MISSKHKCLNVLKNCVHASTIIAKIQSAHEAERKDQEHARVIINHLKTIHKFTMADMGNETIHFLV